MARNNVLEAKLDTMAVNRKKRLIVVLGMHRSGTSAITRSLQVMGVELGDNLMPAKEGINDKGFWEDLDIYALNNELLNIIGSDWHHLAPVGPKDVETLRKSSSFAKAADLLCQKVERKNVFGFKDPRVAKLLLFWKEVFTHCQFDTSCILVVRHPLSVAQSLAKRDGFDAEKSYFLWLGHVIESLASSAGMQRVLVDYDKLIQSPEFEINRIAKGLDLKINSVELGSYITQFLDETLQHSAYDLNDLSLDDTCPLLVREIYTELFNAASNKITLDDPLLKNKIEQWVKEWERLKPILTLVDRFSTRNARGGQNLPEGVEGTTTPSQSVAERDRQIVSLEQALIERDSQIANLNQALIERDNEISNINQARSEISARLTAIENSTLWKMTFPLRRTLAHAPILRKIGRRTVKLVWWTSTFQLGKKLHKWKTPDTDITRLEAPHFAQPIMALSKQAKRLESKFLTHSVWFNGLLRWVYRILPVPQHVKQRLKEIYFSRSSARTRAAKSVFQADSEHETLPLLVASARQFDPADPWVLVVDLRLPTPDQDSGSVRMSAILRLLKEMRFRVTFISDSETYLPDYQKFLEKEGIEVLQGFGAACSHLRTEGGKYHFVLLSRPEVAFRYLAYARGCALYSTIIYDTVDLHWVRFEREMQISGDRSLINRINEFRRIELFNAACADQVLAITNEERDCLLAEQPDAKITVLPNIHEIFPPRTPFAQRRGLLFIGGFWHKPNEDAVIFFVRNILPLIIERIPDLVFYMIGSNMPASVKSLRSANVEPLGFVPDVAPYFESCRIFVAPLRFGAGMKGKVGQSMSHGLPVITTRIGAEGMGLEHEKHLLVADNEMDFANWVVRLYNDEILWHKLANVSLSHVEANYSLAAARKRMSCIFSPPQNESSSEGYQKSATNTVATSAGDVPAGSTAAREATV